MYGDKWSIDDMKLVNKLHREGVSDYQIGVQLDRTEFAVKSVLRKINLAKRLGLKVGTKAFAQKITMGENQLRRVVVGY